MCCVFGAVVSLAGPALAAERWEKLKESDAPAGAGPAKPEEEKPTVTGNPYRPSAEQPRYVAPADAGDQDDGDSYSVDVAWMKDWTPRFTVRHARLDFDVWSRQSGETFTWDAALQLGVDDALVFFDLNIPLTYSETRSRMALGNPSVGVHGGGHFDEVALWAGLQLSVPTASLSDRGRILKTRYEAALVRAGIGSDRFVVSYVPIRGQIGVEVQLHPLLYLRINAEPVVFVPTEDVLEVAVQFDQVNDIELLSPIGLGGGLRLQEAFILSDANDQAQVAVEPFLSYRPAANGPYASAFIARIGMLVALDDPLGLGFKTNEVLTLRTSVGARF